MSWRHYHGAMWQCDCGEWVPVGLPHRHIKLRPLPDPCTIAYMDVDSTSLISDSFTEVFQKPDSKVYRGDNR
jgi:hypothetical protein